MFGRRALEYDRVVAVVCGGCIDNEVLGSILRNVDDSNSKCGGAGGDRLVMTGYDVWKDFCRSFPANLR